VQNQIQEGNLYTEEDLRKILKQQLAETKGLRRARRVNKDFNFKGLIRQLRADDRIRGYPETKAKFLSNNGQEWRDIER
jgi:hypothetical protein